MGTLSSYPSPFEYNISGYLSYPLDSKHALLFLRRNKSVASYGLYWYPFICSKTEYVPHPRVSRVYFATGFFDNMGTTTLEKVDDENYLVCESKAYTNQLGISGPSFASGVHYVSLDDGTVDDYASSTPIGGSSASYNEIGVPDKTKFLWPAQRNNSTYYTWQYNHESARVSNKEFIVWGYASDIYDTDNVGKTNIWATRYKTVGVDDAGPWTYTFTDVPLRWSRPSGFGGIFTTYAMSGTGSVTVSCEPWDPYEEGRTINYTIDYDFSGDMPEDGYTTWHPSMQIYMSTYARTSGVSVSVLSGTETGSFTLYRQNSSVQFYITTTGLPVQPTTTFYSGARTMEAVDVYKDCATALYDEYVGTGTAIRSDGTTRSVNASFSQPTIIGDHLYSWTMDRNDNVIEVDVTLGDEISVAATQHSSVPAKFDFEHARKSYEARGVSLHEWFWSKQTYQRVAPFNFKEKSYSIDHSHVYDSGVMSIPCLFGWAKTGYSDRAYKWGTIDITVSPYPLIQGTNVDVTVTWTAQPPSAPSVVGGGWTGPHYYRSVDYKVGSGNWSSSMSGSTTTLTGSREITTNNLSGIRFRASDRETDDGGVVTISSYPPEKVLDFSIYEPGGPIRMWDDSADPVLTDNYAGNIYTPNSTWVIQPSWPYGHDNHREPMLGMFFSNGYVIPWKYLTATEEDGPPMKTNQRDDGLGNSGGPGRVGYYGHNGGHSSRITNGGAW